MLTPQIVLYVDTSTGNLLAALNLSTTVNPMSLPFAVGDNPMFQVYLLAPLPSYTPSAPSGNYYNIGTAGNALEIYFTNGLDESSPDYAAYTWQNTFYTDPTNAYFYNNISFNQEALVTLLGNNQTASAYMTIGYTTAAGAFTPSKLQVQFTAGLPAVVGPVPAGLTPLSLEVARNLFVPVSGYPVVGGPGGAGFYLTTPSGRKLLIQAIDPPGGGPAEFQATPS
jgi:hypothetical protein